MKKTYLVLLLASLTLGACGTGGINKTDTGTTKKDETPKTETSKSLKELMGLGTSQKCTFESKTEDIEVKSEIIMNGKKFRQTSEITTKEGKTKVYSISDGVYYYSWSDVAKDMGSKMKIEDVENEGKKIAAKGNKEPVKMEGQQQVSMDEKVNYKCTPATLTDADLAIPTDVKFVDYAEMMKGLQNMNLDELKKLAPQE
jgi:hypothetical protein